MLESFFQLIDQYRQEAERKLRESEEVSDIIRIQT